MVACRDFDSYAEDSLRHRVYCEPCYWADLKDLTFTDYSFCLSELEIVPILKFDMSKLSIKKLEDYNFKNLYDSKPLFLSIKAFCALLKKVKALSKTRTLK